jgi:hypothetical protein
MIKFTKVKKVGIILLLSILMILVTGQACKNRASENDQSTEDTTAVAAPGDTIASDSIIN